jgi:putative hemolysin
MIAVYIALMFLLVGASMFLASVEAAFHLTKRRRFIGPLADDRRTEIANRYLDDPPALLMPLHIGTFTAHAGMTVVLAWLFLDVLAHWAMLLAFGAMVLYLLLFRLTLPYALVRSDPQGALLLLLPAFHVYARALAPLVRALGQRGGPADEPEEGATPLPEVPLPPVQDPDEQRLFEAMERFGQTQVRDVMTPRPDIVAVPAAATVADLRRVMREAKYSRMPVFGENLDDVVGVVTVRDLLELDADAGEFVRDLARPVFLVPETKRIAVLLRELQAQRTTLAVVIDEYGGTAGVVSVEDIVEELVGEIKDEHDVEAEPISVDAEGHVLVAGRVNLDRLEQALETSLAGDAEVGTVGGLVTALFGHIPKVGERTEHRGFLVEVVDAERKRVNRVRFTRKPVEVA